MRWKTAIVIVCAVLAVTMFSSFGSNSPVPASRPASDPKFVAKFQGVSSCASAACHGGDGRSSAEGCEFRTWANDDKHAAAYRTLFSDRSKLMLRNYRRLESVADARPHQDKECLACHSVSAPVELVDHEPRRPEAADGVGCESCHGAAERWLTIHYLDDWKLLGRRAKADRFGLVSTKNLAVRVGQCAHCHVGREGQEVNHDLIAAGHPRLRFEFATYQHNMPSHWREKSYGPDFAVRAWAIGQVASARAAIDLLRSRAERAMKETAPWPELAEYNCYGCHHDLGPQSWRAKADRPRPGLLQWGTWYNPLLGSLAEVSPLLSANDRQPRLEVYQYLQKYLAEHPRAAPKDVAPKAMSALKELDGWLADLQAAADRDSLGKSIATADVSRLIDAVLANRASAAELADLDWDQATQRYLAATALYRGMCNLDPARHDRLVEKELGATRDLLLFRRDADGPDRFTPQRFFDSFQRVRAALQRKDSSP
jgi:hypothetical protein